MKIESFTTPMPATSVARARPERMPVAAIPAPVATPALQPSAPQVDAAIEAANQTMQSNATNVKFEKDNTSGKIVVRVVDSETQQVLRQMPSEEMLSMSKALDSLRGLMVPLKV